MSNNGTVMIHGKKYVTVAERLRQAHEGSKLQGVTTEVLQFDPVVVVKATVNISGVLYTGISSANPAKAIEKSNPYEVAETSAIGRALGFANFGLEDSIASADEMIKAAVGTDREFEYQGDEDFTREAVDQSVGVVKAASAVNWKKCPTHGKAYNADKYTQCFLCAQGATSDDNSTRST